MDKVIPRPGKVEMDFTDARLTGFGGWSILARTAERLGLLRRLSGAVSVKSRARGASDGEMLWSLVASLAAGNGSLSDLDALRRDGVGKRLLGSREAPAVVSHEVASRGYVPVFIDGTGIEVGGALFQWARTGYYGARQYWLHGVFVGGLWASGRLCPGGVDVALGWRDQLEMDVAPLLPAGTPVWLRADNAYYRGE